MTEKLRRSAIASVIAIAVLAAQLAFTAILMEVCWAIWDFAPPHRYDLAMRTGLNIWLFLVGSGVLPAMGLRMMRTRSLLAYLVVGAGSTLLAIYTLLTMMHFGPPDAFCCLQNPSLRDLLVFLFTGGRGSVRGFLDTNGYASVIGFAAAPGLIFGLVLGLVLRPRRTVAVLA